MLTLTYLAIISVATDAAVIAKRNQSEAVTYPEVNAVIALNETDASQPGDNLDSRPTVKDVQSPSWNVEECDPETNFHVTQKMPLRRNITKAAASISRKKEITDGFKVYFGSDEERIQTRISKPVPEDDGRIYFEPMLQRKNATKLPEKDSSNIMRIEPDNNRTIATTMSTTSAAMDEVTLDNRNAFGVPIICTPVQSKVMGKCVDPE